MYCACLRCVVAFRVDPLRVLANDTICLHCGKNAASTENVAKGVDLDAFEAFYHGLKPNVYWHDPNRTDINGHKMPPHEEGVFFCGEMMWAAYSYMCTQGDLRGKPDSYNNRLEAVYLEVTMRLVERGFFRPVERDAYAYVQRQGKQYPRWYQAVT